MKRQRLTAVLAVVAALVAFVPISAQVAAQRPMDLEDILAYRALGQTVLSQNGEWLAYRLSPLEGDSQVIVRHTSADRQMSYDVGQGNGAVTFSDDSAWAAVTTSLTELEAEAARRAGDPVQNSVRLVNLATGDDVVIPKIRRFAFNGEMGGWIALDRYGPNGSGGAAAGRGGGRGGRGGRGGGAPPTAVRDGRPRGTDLLLRDLEAGTEISVGNVAEFAFDKSGRYLALVIDAADQAGNGIQIRNMATGAVTSLETDQAFYERMSWTDEGDALVALKGKDDSRFEDRVLSIVAFTGFGDSEPSKVAYDPMDDAAFPEGLGISSNRAPRWTESRDAITFGIAELAEADPPARGGRGANADSADSEGGRGGNDDDRPSLVIWHYQDPRLQSMQEVQESRDRQFNYLSLYRVADATFVRLATDEVADVTLNEDGPWALGSSDDPYELRGNLDGQRYRDFHAIDTRTGQSRLLKSQVRWGYGLSPDSTQWLYYEDAHFHVMDAATGQSRNITESVDVSFVNVEDDHNVEDPPARQLGWTADSAAVLLTDNWDIWRIPVDGSDATNLTANGKEDGLRYRQRVRVDPDENGIDLSNPQYISVLAEWTKKAGYGVLEPGQAGVRMLLWDDAQFNRLQKAEAGDVWLYSRETPTDAADLYATDSELADGRRLTDLSGEAEPFLWTDGAQLLDYKNEKGARLQASLYLPAPSSTSTSASRRTTISTGVRPPTASTARLIRATATPSSCQTSRTT